MYYKSLETFKTEAPENQQGDDKGRITAVAGVSSHLLEILITIAIFFAEYLTSLSANSMWPGIVFTPLTGVLSEFSSTTDTE